MPSELKFRLIKDGQIVGYERWFPTDHQWQYRGIGFPGLVSFIDHDTKEQLTCFPNEQEIYEGDRLRIEIHQHITGKIIAAADEVVEFRGDRFGVEWGFSREFTGLTGFSNTTFRVVGNIHDKEAPQ